MKKRQLALAIGHMREARRIHAQWARWARRVGRHPALRIAGAARHHELWIKRYDRVIRLLERARG